jgi:hypothetical protein
MTIYQLLRTYLEAMFGNVYDRARTDERGMTAEAIIVTAAAIVGCLAVTLILWQKLKAGANNVTVPSPAAP